MNTKDKKRVNVKALSPVRVLSIPIRGESKGLLLSIEDIFKVICQKAIVDEVLPDGTLVRLDLSNYNKDNSKKEEKVVEVQQGPVVQNVVPTTDGFKTEFKKEEVVQTPNPVVIKSTEEEEFEKQFQEELLKEAKEKEVIKEEKEDTIIDSEEADFEVTEDDEDYEKINKSLGK